MRLGVLVAAAIVVLAYALSNPRDNVRPRAAEPTPTTATSLSSPPRTTPGGPWWVDPATMQQPWGSTPGMLTFRGNPSRSYYGQGPLPATPVVRWRFPASGGMCAKSSSEGVTKTWCGTGWTGQVNTWERSDGTTWAMFGGFDRAYHFLDAQRGTPVVSPFATGDINKGSATLDPDGYPLYYAGSRDGWFRVIALDRGDPAVLYQFNAHDVAPTLWNDDWDGAALVLNDYLFEGGENSRWHVWKLNRSYGADGKVAVAPKLVFDAAGWDDQLLKDVGDRDVSIEDSLTIVGNTVWFANSGGLVQGWDISGLANGTAPTRIFRFWTGDDTDATVTVDDEGFLYVASEFQRGNERAKVVGQLMKLDPRKPDNPLVWSIKDQGYKGFEGASGFWSTPAIAGPDLIAATAGGRLLSVDRQSGAIRWTKRLPGPLLSSPVVVDGTLLQADCGGVLHAYALDDPSVEPSERWSVNVGGCLEATPTVWKGWIFQGSRDGYVVGISDPA